MYILFVYSVLSMIFCLIFGFEVKISLFVTTTTIIVFCDELLLQRFTSSRFEFRPFLTEEQLSNLYEFIIEEQMSKEIFEDIFAKEIEHHKFYFQSSKKSPILRPKPSLFIIESTTGDSNIMHFPVLNT